MAQSQNVFRRIRNIKHSLENAEQSFLDNKGIRGELDLMLAEAEFSNLRRKKDVPWHWNRQLLALCMAVLLGLSGFGGWYYAVHHARAAMPDKSAEVKQNDLLVDNKFSDKTADISITDAVNKMDKPVQNTETVPVNKKSVAQTQNMISQQQKQQVMLSDADMRRLVKSARTELTSSN